MNGAWKTLFPVFLGVIMALIAVVLWKAVRKKEVEAADAAGAKAIAPHATKALEEIRKRKADVFTGAVDAAKAPAPPSSVSQEGFQSTGTPATVTLEDLTAKKAEFVRNWKALLTPGGSTVTESGVAAGYVIDVPSTTITKPQTIPYTMQFAKTPVDSFYDLYEQDQYQPPEGRTPETITIKETELPDYGASLNAFDSEILSIPWDSDNKDLLPRDILWGLVSPEASKAIFLKTYNRTIFGNVNNLQISDAGKMEYYSPTMGITVDSSETIFAVQAAEAVFSAVGNLAMDALFEPVTGELLSKQKFGLSFTNPITKELNICDPFLKFKGGAQRMKGLLKKMLPKIAQKMAKAITKMVAKYILKSVILRAILAAMAVVASVTIFAAAAVWSTISVVYGVLSIFDMFVMAIAITLTPVFDNLFDANGTCPPGTTAVDDIIPSAVYWMIVNLLPMGDILDLTGPYLCSKSNGEAVPRVPIGSQPYYEDSTLSIYYHNWKKSELPRSPSKRKKPLETPKGFEYCIHDKCYAKCDEGSFNKTEVDEVCYRDEYAIEGRISTDVFNETIQCKESEVLLDGLCYPICKDKFTRMSLAVGGYKCVANAIPDSVTTRRTTPRPTTDISDAGYNPVNYPLNTLTFSWCNFASPEMMDRMAQFYYDQSFRNSYPIDNSGTVQFEFIDQFFGVIASSELSCDVACDIRQIRFNPVTGENFKEILPVPDETGSTMSYRRFYFASNKANGDGNGLFTVTGCTNTQYTAPDAMKNSAEGLMDGEEYVPSVPKIFEITKKAGPNITQRIVSGTLSFIQGAATAGATIGAARAAGRRGGAIAGAAAGAGVGVAAIPAGGLVGEWFSNLSGLVKNDDEIRTAALARGATYEGQDSHIINACINPVTNEPRPVSDCSNMFILVNDTPAYYINRGPIKELSIGYDPRITYCKDVKVLNSTCGHKYVLRDVIAKYQAANPGKRVKLVTGIEARGGIDGAPNGCWYGWKEVSFDAANNLEGTTQIDKEIVQAYTVGDNLTCVMKPGELDMNVATYPVRKVSTVNNSDRPSIIDNNNPRPGPYQYVNKYKNWWTYQNVSYDFNYNYRTYLADAEYEKLLLNGIVTINILPNREVFGKIKLVDPTANKEYRFNIESYRNALEFSVIDRVAITESNKISKTYSVALGVSIVILISNTQIFFYINGDNVHINSRVNELNYLKIQFTTQKNEYNPPNDIIDVIKNVLDKDITFSYISFFQPMLMYPNRKELKQTDLNRGVIPFNDTEQEEVFAVGPCNTDATFTKAAAATKCQQLGARAATFLELMGAYAAGADWCCPGWLSDSAAAYYPITTRINQCGGGSAGIKVQQGATTAAAICYGIKPAKGADPTILDFNESSYYGILRTAPILPRVPFAPPVTMPPEAVLGGASGPCPTRKCKDTEQIEQLITDFNAAHSDKKILKVTKAWTATETRCDYEVEMRRTRNPTTPILKKDIISKETLRIDVRAPAAGEPACIYRRTGDGSAALNSGTYIMAGMEELEKEVAVGTNLLSKVKASLATSLQPALTVNLKTGLVDPTKAAAAAAKETLQKVAEQQGFTGCSDANACSRPAILAAMQHRYNSDFSYLEPFGGERNIMKRILRSKVSGPNMCDVQFENLYEYNEDILYPPDESDVSTLTYRFKLTGGQGCDGWKVAEAGSDISGSSIVLSMADSKLTTPFTKGSCTFSCLDPLILRDVKTQLDTKYTTTKLVQTFHTVTQSFRAGNEVCEYTILKDRLGRDVIRKEDVDEADVETVVRASMTFNPVTCSKSVDYVEEFSYEDITPRKNAKGEDEYYRNGKKITVPMPALYFYDPEQYKEVSKKVGTKVTRM